MTLWRRRVNYFLPVKSGRTGCGWSNTGSHNVQ